MEKTKRGFAGFVKDNWLVVVTGLLIGAAAVVLSWNVLQAREEELREIEAALKEAKEG